MLTNRKAPERKGKVQLIDATSFWVSMRKSLGAKRREIPFDRKQEILELLREFQEDKTCHIYPTTHFGFHKITVERPLRLDFQAGVERIERLKLERAFQNLAVSRKRGPAKAAEEEAGRVEQKAILDFLATLPDTLYLARSAFVGVLDTAVKEAGIKLAAPVRKAIPKACEAPRAGRMDRHQPPRQS